MSYIKLDRKILDWEWKDDPKMVALWVEILLQANYCDERWHGEEYEKGSFPTSLGRLAESTGLSVSQVRTCLNKLKKTQEIDTKITGHSLKIIVKKWALYQGLDENDDTKIARKSHVNRTNIARSSHEVSNTIRNKEIKKERNIYNSIPVYDPSSNEKIDKEEEEELMKLMGRA